MLAKNDDLVLKQIAPLIQSVRTANPLIHNMTNDVVTNFTANGLLALGASPVMSSAPEEVAELASIAGALVLNIGTLSSEQVAAMIIAGKAANQAGVPVILDPVASGATKFRTESALRILQEVKVELVRGNVAEIASISGEEWSIKGVDTGAAAGEDDIIRLASGAARKWNTHIVITGEVDIVSNGRDSILISGGHPLLTKVTGTGCLLTSVIGAFRAVTDDTLFAAAAALTMYAVSAEQAAAEAADKGPGTFAVKFIDQLSKLSPDHMLQHGKIRSLNHGVTSLAEKGVEQ